MARAPKTRAMQKNQEPLYRSFLHSPPWRATNNSKSALLLCLGAHAFAVQILIVHGLYALVSCPGVPPSNINLRHAIVSV